MSATLRRARVGDVAQIQRLINFYAERGKMLPRSLNEIYENLRDYYVVEGDARVVACAACHVAWENLAEIKSLAVEMSWARQGWGTRLVEACLEDARQLGLPRVFTLTYQPEFFSRLGFGRVDKSDLPHKVWSECINCVKFPDCGEVALVLNLTEEPIGSSEGADQQHGEESITRPRR